MIEIVAGERCIGCDRCIEVCPTRVFDRGADGIPVIARHDSCQTCFQCEAYCPTDALFVAPLATPAAADSSYRDTAHLQAMVCSAATAANWAGEAGARLARAPPSVRIIRTDNDVGYSARVLLTGLDGDGQSVLGRGHRARRVVGEGTGQVGRPVEVERHHPVRARRCD